jgi:methanogenic corrinoid protein MtbC1
MTRPAYPGHYPTSRPVTAPHVRRRAGDILAAGLADRMGAVLRTGDGRSAEAVVDEALSAGLSPADVRSLVIAPAMVGIGELWESGALTVAEEHLATSIRQRVLIRILQ